MPRLGIEPVAFWVHGTALQPAEPHWADLREFSAIPCCILDFPKSVPVAGMEELTWLQPEAHLQFLQPAGSRVVVCICGTTAASWGPLDILSSKMLRGGKDLTRCSVWGSPRHTHWDLGCISRNSLFRKLPKDLHSLSKHPIQCKPSA